MSEYDPDSYWNERTKKYKDLGDGYRNRDIQDYEMKVRMKKAYEALGNISGLKILDVGCGIGRWSLDMARKGAIVTAIDISEENLKIAIANAEKDNIGNVDFINKKIEDIDRSELFDIVFTATVLQHIVDNDALETAVSNMTSLTRTGGKILIIESSSVLGEREERLENGQVYLKIRPKEIWVSIFRNNGAECIFTREVCYNRVKKAIILCSNLSRKIRLPLIKKVFFALCEFVDFRLIGLFAPDNCSPTIFLFKKTGKIGD